MVADVIKYKNLILKRNILNIRSTHGFIKQSSVLPQHYLRSATKSLYEKNKKKKKHYFHIFFKNFRICLL